MFQDRTDAGKKLAAALVSYKDSSAVVLALPRGGVVVGYQVSKELNLPLEVLLVRKIGAPFNPESAIGAISEKNTIVMSKNSIVDLNQEKVKKTIDREEIELERRIKIYRQGRQLSDLKNKTVIIIDDGLATGLTAQAAIAAVKKFKVKRVIFASPVCAKDSLSTISDQVDNINCLLVPDYLSAIGLYYEDFSQVSDEEVIRLLTDSRKK